jgi:hypothetical protein
MRHIVFSVQKSEFTVEHNSFNHATVKDFLQEHDVKFIEVNGCYEGKPELSLLVSDTQESLVKTLCFAYRQDCYLHVDQNGNATLKFTTGVAHSANEASIGVWQQVCRSVAESQIAYTEFNGSYYVCSKDNLPSPAFKGGI